MIKRIRANHPLGYCVLAEVLFLVGMMVFTFAALLAAGLMGLNWILADEFLTTILQEIFGVGIGLLLLWRSGKLSLLWRRGCGFLDGMLIGMYPFVIVSWSLISTLLLARPENTPLKPAGEILVFFLAMFMVGAAEEILFRGVIAETLLERFGTSRSGIWKACALSALFFSAAHLTNLMGSEPLGVLVQCAFTFSFGVLLAAIYFRTGNLWVPIFIHAYMDVAGLLLGGLYGTQSTAEVVSGYDLSNLITVAIYLLPALVLLRRKKLPLVGVYFSRDLPQKTEPESSAQL